MIFDQSMLADTFEALKNDNIIRIINSFRSAYTGKMEHVVKLFIDYHNLLHPTNHTHQSKLDRLKTWLIMDLINIVRTNDIIQRYILINLIDKEEILTILSEYKYIDNDSFQYGFYYARYKIKRH